MDKLKKVVDETLNSFFVGEKTDNVFYGTTPDDFLYALVTTKGLWYKIRVFAYIEKCIDTTMMNTSRPYLMESYEHFTESKTQNHIKELKDEISKGIYNSFFPQKSTREFEQIFLGTLKSEKLPIDAITNPDNYLIRGDVIETNFSFIGSHYGIYIGNKKVVHVSGHGNGKNASVVRIGDLCPHFVEANGKLSKIKFAYRLRTPEKAAELAEDYAKQCFRNKEYNLIAKNCEHFATLCAYGFEFSVQSPIDMPGHNGW